MERLSVYIAIVIFNIVVGGVQYLCFEADVKRIVVIALISLVSGIGATAFYYKTTTGKVM